MLISSSQNATFKYIKSLKLKKYRSRAGVILLEGRRLIEQVLQLGYQLEYLVLEETCSHPPIDGVTTIYLPMSLFKQISDTVHSQGVVAVVKGDQNRTEIDYTSNVIVLNDLQDPGNVGTILRTAESFGFKNVIATKGCVDLFSPKVLRASMGAPFNLSIVQNVTSAELIAQLKDSALPIVVTALQDSEPLKSHRPKAPFAIVFGNEGAGVEPIWLECADARLKIEMVGAMQSLNVGVSAGIILYSLQSAEND